jgi:LPXTG-site transpeptidase (sortase) family protein
MFMSRRVQKWVGNILIIFALGGLAFIYYPILKEFLFPPHYTMAQKEKIEFSIEIPSINVFSPVIANVDPFNPKDYLEKLKYGVAQAKGTSLPGEKGTMYLFAHSSDVPWRITRYNTAFFKLPFVKKGDAIIIRRNGKVYRYKIYEQKTVWPNETSYLTKSQGDILILQTCVPVGTSLQRLLVFAKPVN